jgi:hypothetical protein
MKVSKFVDALLLPFVIAFLWLEDRIELIRRIESEREED